MPTQHSVSINDANYDLAALEQYLWTILLEGTLRSRNGFHTGSFVSLDTDGMPDARTVVVRKVLPENRAIWFHTDKRSDKIAAFEKGEIPIAWLFYDAQSRMQIRLKGTARLAEDTTLQWQNTPLMSRRCYLTTHAPGTPSVYATSDLPEPFDTRDPNAEESTAGEQNFAVVHTTIQRIDWLYLHHAGHRRALFEYDATDIHHRKILTSTWLVP